MEEKEIAVNINNAKLVLDKHLLFKWECVEQRNVGKTIYFKFKRDNEVPYYDELVKLENEYPDYKIKSLIPVSLMPIVTFALVTIFLVVFLMDRENFNFTLMFSLLMIPAMLVLLLTVLFTVLRLKAINKIDKEKPTMENMYREKIAELEKQK